VLGYPVEKPETIATAIRIGKPASWELALAARDDSNGYFGAMTDQQILEAHRILSAEVGVFVEPASAAPIAGLLERAAAGEIPAGSVIAVTVTGHGLKDPQWGARNLDGTEVTPTVVSAETSEVASVLGLQRDH
jgi:threonine synthase